VRSGSVGIANCILPVVLTIETSRAISREIVVMSSTLELEHHTFKLHSTRLRIEEVGGDMIPRTVCHTPSPTPTAQGSIEKARRGAKSRSTSVVGMASSCSRDSR